MDSTPGIQFRSNHADGLTRSFRLPVKPDRERYGPATSTAAQQSIRIYTLGRLGVAIDGQAIHSGGKGQQRPISLFKALIALGGRDVSSSPLWECLWPDAEGDLGARNLAITVHRLRRMLGCHDAVLQHDGKLSLNDRVCWVDAWAFERLVNEGLRGLEEGESGPDAKRALQAALALYGGPFLAREAEEAWMLAPRLRLEIKFERLVAGLSSALEREGRILEAIDICLSALEREPLNEPLYRRLMDCYVKASEFSSAARTYIRCRRALVRGLGMEPSEQTQRIFLDALRMRTAARSKPAAGDLAGTATTKLKTGSQVELNYD
ncbi:MAG: bacterial transcriptional activator domain-containing protein [Burkholderiales bacterium]